jgi:predicted DNA-binding transcriptional regulator YafY
MAEFTFVTNHAAVLLHIAQNPRITGREIATGTGISERAVRKIIADLDREHYISKKREGRHVLYTIYPDAKMRHLSVQEIAVGGLLEALGWQKVTIEAQTPKLVEARNKSPPRHYQTTEQEERSIENTYSQL